MFGGNMFLFCLLQPLAACAPSSGASGVPSRLLWAQLLSGRRLSRQRLHA